GYNIEISGDNVLSKINGCIVLTETGIDVEPLLLAKNVRNWNKKHEGSISIMGDVDNCPLIEASGDIEIHGLAANSNLKAGRNIFIHGNIMAKDENSIAAGGDILSKNISNASIAADNLFVLSIILNSDVTALGTVQTLEKTGKIIGGGISSCSMVKTGAIGSAKAVDTKVRVATPKLIKQVREHLLDNLIIRIGSIDKKKEQMVLKLKTLKEKMDKTLGSKFGGYNKVIELTELEIEKCEGKVADLYKEIVKVKDPSHIATSGEVIADVYHPGTVISIGNSSRNINAPKHKIRFYTKESNVFSEEHKGI
ncbi:MAG: FapA family protein, partial [Candidatus Desulfatibia sp.]|uniref:FapA family protein n=1 Tax=Candidatus Desulfatibia sp. TaxID=3101189 RepID=UPI002F2E8C9E